MVTGTGSVAQGVPVSTNSIKSDMSVDSTIPPRRTSDNRRSNKPIMEKRRRARINNCLNELKALILDAMKKDPARHSKLEKADILEMTVKHLENLQRQQVAMSAATDPAVLNKFRAGFSECAGEVGRFPGLDPTVKRRLLQHLANCLAGSTQLKQQQQQQQQQDQQVTNSTHQASVQVHILPSPHPAAPTESHVPTLTAQNGIIFSNVNGTGVQLVPTRLPNGDIALVLPTTGQQTTMFRQHVISSPSSSPSPSSVSSTSSSGGSPLPMLVPIPTRTASTASAASSTSSSAYERISHSHVGRDSATPSPVPMETAPHHPAAALMYSPPAQAPLSLVMRKSYDHVDEEKPWRPW